MSASANRPAKNHKIAETHCGCPTQRYFRYYVLLPRPVPHPPPRPARGRPLDGRPGDLPHTDPQYWIGLLATDLSAQGIRLQGLESDDVRRLLTDEGHAQMTLRLPLMRPPPPPLAAELRWGLGEKPNFYTGWLFSKIDADTLKLIDNYIADHPQDLIKDPT